MGKKAASVTRQASPSSRPNTRSPKCNTTAPEDRGGDKLTYALKAYTAERRKDGWWVSPTWFTASGQKPQWCGPFDAIETACLAVARRLATELADRHTFSIETRKLDPGDPLYGLKATTRLPPAPNSGSTC